MPQYHPQHYYRKETTSFRLFRFSYLVILIWYFANFIFSNDIQAFSLFLKFQVRWVSEPLSFLKVGDTSEYFWYPKFSNQINLLHVKEIFQIQYTWLFSCYYSIFLMSFMQTLKSLFGLLCIQNFFQYKDEI